MTESETIQHDARHYFDNCKAAFRLLQGAMLSGNYPTTDEEREELSNRFIEIEKKIGGDKNAVKKFFTKMPPNKDNLKAAKTRMKYEGKQIIIIDDQYESAGWKETFEFIFGNKVVKGFNTIDGFNKYIKNASPQAKRVIFSIFVDINFSSKNKRGRQGIEYIKHLSKNYPPAIPIVAFSAYDSSVWVKDAFSYGAWDYFSKDPDEKQSAESRTATQFYNKFVNISDRFYQYHSDFSNIYTKITTLEDFLRNYGKGGKTHKSNAMESIWTAYRYLILDAVIPFSPDFFKKSKEDEIVFQMTKAFEAFLVCILEANRLYPYKTNFSMGELVDKLRDLNSLKIKTELWWDQLYKIVNARNDKMHRYKFSNRSSKFVVKPDNISYKDAKNLFDNALDKMIEILGEESGK